RRRDEATVNERGIAADADEASPRAHADDRPEMRLAEEPRKRVAARARELVNDQHLRTVNSEQRVERRLAVAWNEDRLGPPAEIVDDVVGDLTSVIEALVENDTLLVDLREIVAVEVREATVLGVRQIDVGELSATEPVDQPAVRLDPREVA